MLGKTQVLLRDSKGDEVKHHMAYLEKTNPVKETVKKVPDFKVWKDGKTPTEPRIGPKSKMGIQSNQSCCYLLCWKQHPTYQAKTGH